MGSMDRLSEAGDFASKCEERHQYLCLRARYVLSRWISRQKSYMIY